MSRDSRNQRWKFIFDKFRNSRCWKSNVHRLLLWSVWCNTITDRCGIAKFGNRSLCAHHYFLATISSRMRKYVIRRSDSINKLKCEVNDVQQYALTVQVSVIFTKPHDELLRFMLQAKLLHWKHADFTDHGVGSRVMMHWSQ
jgi:hypothetical protein